MPDMFGDIGKALDYFVFTPIGKSVTELVGNANTIGNAVTKEISDYTNAPVKAAGIQGEAIQKAIDIQTEIANKAIAAAKQGNTDAIAVFKEAQANILKLQKEQYNQQRADLLPYQTAGTNALAKLQNMEYRPFVFNQDDPSYQWRFNQGVKALERSAAARGGMITGNTLAALTNYGQQAGSQEYQNAFNRFQTEYSNKLAPLQYLTNLGYTATGQGVNASQGYAGNAGNAYQNYGANIGNAYQNYGANVGNAYQQTGSNIGNLQVGRGNALAQGLTDAAQARMGTYVAGTNLLTNALNGAINLGQNALLMGKLG